MTEDKGGRVIIDRLPADDDDDPLVRCILGDECRGGEEDNELGDLWVIGGEGYRE